MLMDARLKQQIKVCLFEKYLIVLQRKHDFPSPYFTGGFHCVIQVYIIDVYEHLIEIHKNFDLTKVV